MARRNTRPATDGGESSRRSRTADLDGPWKEALDRFFEQCMAFFFPGIHAEIDWSRGYEMLDKELQPIVRRSAHGRRYVDKLVKVWLNTGEERWILVHLEVQGSRETDFPRRMHIYNHRIFDRHGREVISLAILTDDDLNWRPDRYEYSRWGFRTLTEFPVVKLLDHAGRYQELESDPNQFAVVVLAHLKAVETRRSPSERHTWKVRLVKGLYDRGMDPEDIRHLFRFIAWVMELPEPLQHRFLDEIETYQQEKMMPYVSIEERVALERGLLRGIEVVLEVKFGTSGLELMPEIKQIRDDHWLGKILDRLKTAESLEDFRRYVKRQFRAFKKEEEEVLKEAGMMPTE